MLNENSQQSKIFKALTALVRNDYSFSDYSLGPSFHNLTLLQAPFTSEIVVSKQMLKELAIQPLFQTFCLGMTLKYFAVGINKSDQVAERGSVRKRINFSALLANDTTPGGQID